MRQSIMYNEIFKELHKENFQEACFLLVTF